MSELFIYVVNITIFFSEKNEPYHTKIHVKFEIFRLVVFFCSDFQGSNYFPNKLYFPPIMVVHNYLCC